LAGLTGRHQGDGVRAGG